MFNGFLPIFAEGTQKDYQKHGNGLNMIDLIQCKNTIIPNFISDWYEYNSYLRLKSVKLYSLPFENIRMIRDYESLIFERTLVKTLSNTQFNLETKTVSGTTYFRVYSKDNVAIGQFLIDGVYELVIEIYTDDALNFLTLESEIFSTNLIKTGITGQLQCSNAACLDVTSDENPIFTIDIEEITGLASATGALTVKWTINQYLGFPYVFNEFVFSDVLEKDLKETQQISLNAGQGTTLTFTYPNYLAQGTYFVEYESDFGCNGIIVFEVTENYWQLNSHDWEDIDPQPEWQRVTFKFSITNISGVSKLFKFTRQLNIEPVESEERLFAVGETYEFEYSYMVDRTKTNYITINGDIAFQDSLSIVLPS